MEVLAILLIVLLVVTLVGHGIWAFFAWLFGARARRSAGICCPRCGAPMFALPCRSCGYGAMDRTLITREVLAKLVNDGLLDAEVKLKVEQALAGQKIAKIAHAGAAIPEARLEIPEARLASPAGVQAVEEISPPIPPLPHPSEPAVIPPRVPPVREERRIVPPTQPVAPRPQPVVAPPPPPPPAKPFSRVMAGFLEERNIRWGELVGGMLIVGCSIALVLSLWSAISQRPFLKVGVFTGVVASLLGLGIYSHRKWRLPNTTFAILVIGMLMVPLHFAAMVVIGAQQQASALAVEALAVALLTWLVHLGTGVITRSYRAIVAPAVIALSLTGPAFYLAGFLTRLDTPPSILLTAGAIVAAYLGASGWLVRKVSRVTEWSSTFARESATALGLLLFAAIPSLVMQAHFATGEIPPRFFLLPLHMAIPSLLLVAACLLGERSPGRTYWTLAFTAVQAMAGSAIVLIALATLGQPTSALIGCAIASAVLLAVAWQWRSAWAFAGACLILCVGYMVLPPVLLGRISPGSLALSGNYLISKSTAVEVQPLALILAALAFVFAQRHRHIRRVGLAAAGLVATVSLFHIVVSEYLRAQPIAGAPYVIAAYAVVAIVVGIILPNLASAIIGTLFALAAIDRFRPGDAFSALGVLATFWAVTWTVVRSLRPNASSVARGGAYLALGLAAINILFQYQELAPQLLAARGWWLAAIGGLMLYAGRRLPELFSLEILLAAAVFAQARVHFDTPAHSTDQFILVAGSLLLALHLLRSLVQQFCALRVPILQTELSPIRIVGAVSALAISGITLIWLGDACRLELIASGMGSDIISGIAPGFAWGYISLLLIVSVAIVESLVLRRLSLLGVAVAGIYLLAANFAARSMSPFAASGIRFSATSVLLILSTVIILAGRSGSQHPIVAFLRGRNCLSLALCVGAMPVLALTFLAANFHFQGEGPRPPVPGSLLDQIGAFGNYILPLVLLSAAFATHAYLRRSEALGLVALFILHFALTLGFVLERPVNSPLDFVALVRLNLVCLAACTWLWLLLRSLRRSQADAGPSATPLLRFLAMTALVPVIALLVLDEGRLLLIAGRFVAYSPTDLAISVFATCLAIALAWRIWGLGSAPALSCISLIALGVIISAAAYTSGATPYQTLRILICAHLAACAVHFFFGRRLALWLPLSAQATTYVPSAELPETRDDLGRIHIAYASQTSAQGPGVVANAASTLIFRFLRFMAPLTILTFVVAIRDLVGDPQSPWWTVAAMVGLASLAVIIAQLEYLPGRLYLATLYVCVAVSLIWVSHRWYLGYHHVRDLLFLNLITLAACSIASIILERQVFQPALERVRRAFLPLHVPVSNAALGLLGILALASFFAPGGMPGFSPMPYGACLAVAGMLFARLWDQERNIPPLTFWLATQASLLLLLGTSRHPFTGLLQPYLLYACILSIGWGVVFAYWGKLQVFLERQSARLLPAGQVPVTNAYAGLVALLFLLGSEVYLHATYHLVPMPPLQFLLTAAILFAGGFAMIVVALGRLADPLQLALPKREQYIYIAEAFAGLLFLHVRITQPQLFSGFLQQYWPMVVMLLAFALIGLGEYLKRKDVMVLAEPLNRSAFILALLPAVFHPATPSATPYWLVTLTTTAFYGLLTGYSRSLAPAFLAVLAANATIWATLAGQEPVSLSRHPQLWCLPPAISLIAAARFLRHRLTTQQATALRYSGLLIAYFSSCFDIFSAGLANAPWLAGILGLLSVIGVMVGIFLRLQSFVYTGAAFLTFALALLIFHASVNLHQTWLLWLAGVALGMSILVAFAMFERHRERITQAVSNLRSWET